MQQAWWPCSPTIPPAWEWRSRKAHAHVCVVPCPPQAGLEEQDPRDHMCVSSFPSLLLPQIFPVFSVCLKLKLSVTAAQIIRLICEWRMLPISPVSVTQGPHRFRGDTPRQPFWEEQPWTCR